MKKFSVAAGMAIVLLAVIPIAAKDNHSEDSAEVYNRSGGFYAYFRAEGGGYQGPATLVKTPSGNVRGQAHTKIFSGIPVARKTQITKKFFTRFGPVEARIVLTPTGKGSIHFSN